ncbi:hypothetical protein DLJ46_01965 [Micromonospora globispora]|uniref:Uncharacterized protein n=1 Tax=Micromonospora globispora TaxID=1450148 RepID=A0A317KI34_9ACTN|nr:hypothetical protein [Micromonospora globispora]PWU52998.1 hypothetical protein DLJ46_01965 [Micromonospora globispora]
MGRSLRRVAMLLLGAALLGTVGLAVGSWYGGRGTAPLSPDQPRRMAAELLPAAEPTGASLVHGYRYGIFLAADDFGARREEFWYGHPADCALSEQLRRNAASGGWQGLRRVPGDPCDGWRAERDGLTATLTHTATGSTLRIAPTAPDGFRAATVTGALLGAAAGPTLFWLVARRRRPAPRLVGTLVAVGLLPGVALTWMDLATDGLAEPVWPIWRALAPLLVLLTLVVALVGVVVLVRRWNPTGPATDATAAGREPAIR